ncbi:RISC-loading complex subunit tarbp2-like [Aphis craccivora]|uniref:RISC-loading complex subunit tarbp2-like n=1 Tax=Aphis craccivora TaxID=307492 RepID=A0A6G0YH49_APHCR|nr:RISC-loading complex subunit tarbp2-like [Aphis craccivora]
MGLDLQNNAAHISSLNKTPVTIVQEYASKNHLVPEYDLIHDGTSCSKVSFKYSLSMGNYVAVGKGSSKKEAKHEAALKLLQLMIDAKPQLLYTDFKQWDFDNHVVSPFDNNIKVNAVGKLNEICTNNRLGLPEFNLIREEGQPHAKLFTMSCQVAKMIVTAMHKTKKQAKHLAAVQMVNRLMSIDKSLVIEEESQVSDSMKVVDKVTLLKSNLLVSKSKSKPMDEEITNYHTLLKKTEFINSDTLDKVINHYKKTGNLELHEPFDILNKIVTENEMSMTSVPLEELCDGVALAKCNCLLVIESVFPPIVGVGEADTVEQAKSIAAVELLQAICILLN